MNLKPRVKKQRGNLPHQNSILRGKLMKRKTVYYGQQHKCELVLVHSRTGCLQHTRVVQISIFLLSEASALGGSADD